MITWTYATTLKSTKFELLFEIQSVYRSLFGSILLFSLFPDTVEARNSYLLPPFLTSSSPVLSSSSSSAPRFLLDNSTEAVLNNFLPHLIKVQRDIMFLWVTLSLKHCVSRRRISSVGRALGLQSGRSRV